MIKVSHKAGDTVILNVDIDNLSDQYSDCYLRLYNNYTSTGLDSLIVELKPSKIDGNTITFVFDTKDFANYPRIYFGWFTINNNGIIMNEYYKFYSKY